VAASSSSKLNQERGAFVTLTEHGQLRGCIGYTSASKPLNMTVHDAATLAALRKITPGIPVILSSDYDEAKVMSDDHPEWPEAFLVKPYLFEGLRDALGRTLAKLPASPEE
ncbi:MAG: AMMECR1 domain-containing protein, partial [Geobacteraceae bacterium]